MAYSKLRRKNRVIAIFLSLILGWLGIDRFYLGKPLTAIIKLVTLGGLGFWWVIDLMLLALDAFLYTFGKDTGFVKDGKGQDLVHGLALYRLKNGRVVKDWFASDAGENMMSAPERVANENMTTAPERAIDENVMPSRQKAETNETQTNQEVRRITYTVKTQYGSTTSSQTLQGTSKSTITKKIGTEAGTGRFVANLAELQGFSPDTRVCFNGRISSSNQLLVYNFAVCIREEFRGINDSGNPIWKIYQIETPPLFVELSDGIIQIVNDDYGLTIKATEHSVNGYIIGRSLYYPQEDNLICDEIAGQFSQRACGLELGDEVVVVGTVEQTGDRMTIVAENIASNNNFSG